MPTTMRQIVLATILLAILTVGFYVTNARTATTPQRAAAGVAVPPIGILDLMASAKDLPEHQYEAF